MTAYFVNEGRTLAAGGHGEDGLAQRNFTAGQRVPHRYVLAISEERLAELKKAGVIYSQDVPDPITDDGPKAWRVAPGHSVSTRHGVIPEGQGLTTEQIEEMHPNHFAQLVEDGTVIEDKGGAA